MKGPMKWCAIPVLLVQVMSGGAKADFTSAMTCGIGAKPTIR
jgi:hypothetical protein